MAGAKSASLVGGVVWLRLSRDVARGAFCRTSTTAPAAHGPPPELVAQMFERAGDAFFA